MATKPRDWLIAWGVALALGIAVMILQLVAFTSGARRRWPPVEDRDMLLRDCATLLTHPGEVPEPNWPASLRLLRPVYVGAEEDHVVITISTGGIGASYGYLVYPDERTNVLDQPGLVLRGAVSPGVFKYETDE